MIRFAYFDVGGTLIAPEPSVGAVYRNAGTPYGLRAAPEALEQAFRDAWPRHVATRGKINFGIDDPSTRDWWRAIVFEVLAQVGFEGSREPVFDACYRAFAEPWAWRVFDDVAPTLAAMEARGIRLGILSNWDLRLPPLLDALDLTRRFEVVLVSAIEQLEKPDRRIFERACLRAGLAPEEILFVGDHPAIDVVPARELGMQAFLIDRRQRRSGPEVVRSLTELLSKLDP